MSNAIKETKPTNPLTREQQRLVSDHLESVRKYSRTFKPPFGMDASDLEQVACMGLIQAAQDFDASLGVKFVSHAFVTAKRFMLKARNESGATYVPSRVARGTTKSEEAAQKKEARLQQAEGARFPESMNAPAGEGGVETLQDLLGADAMPTDEALAFAEEMSITTQALGKLDPADRELILAIQSGLTYRQLKDQFGLSPFQCACREQTITARLKRLSWGIRVGVQAAQ